MNLQQFPGHVDKEEDYRSRGWEFKSRRVPTKKKEKGKRTDMGEWVRHSEEVLGRTSYRKGKAEQRERGGW